MKTLKQTWSYFVACKVNESIIKIAFPSILVGTWLGYFAGTPKYSVFFYIAWPFVTILLVLAVMFFFDLARVMRKAKS